MATLRIIAGTAVGSSFPLGQTQIIGREPRCAIAIDDQAISRQHARLFLQQGSYWITDLASANGIWIDEERVQKVPLESGARFRIGKTIFEIQYETVAKATAAPAVATAEVGEGIALRGKSLDRVIAARKDGQPKGVDLGQLPADKRWILYLAAVILAAGIGLLAMVLTGGIG